MYRYIYTPYFLAHTHIHTSTDTDKLTHVYTHTPSHIHTHTFTHIHTPTHTYAHTALMHVHCIMPYTSCIYTTDCGVIIHKHCEYRVAPCKAQIESGSYVTMSRKKIVKTLDDLDDLTQFLMHKITLLNKDRSSTNSKVDRVFEDALLELHNSLVSNYSLTLQVFTYLHARIHAHIPAVGIYNVMCF